MEPVSTRRQTHNHIIYYIHVFINLSKGFLLLNTHMKETHQEGKEDKRIEMCLSRSTLPVIFFQMDLFPHLFYSTVDWFSVFLCYISSFHCVRNVLVKITRHAWRASTCDGLHMQLFFILFQNMKKTYFARTIFSNNSWEQCFLQTKERNEYKEEGRCLLDTHEKKKASLICCLLRCSLENNRYCK